MTDSIAIHWFRQDLRLSDNPALTKASKHKNVMPIYILDDCNCGEFGLGAASKWWLYHSLNELNASLNYTLSIYRGNPIDILMDTVTRHDVKAVYWNRCYEPWRMQRDTKIKDHLKGNDIEVESYNGSLLWEPWTIKKTTVVPIKYLHPFIEKDV
jgi:deoxyribodipyrimidine photo-lyase